MAQRIAPQMRVRNKRTGEEGVTCPDMGGMLSVCTAMETPVVYDGSGASCGTDTDELEVLGPEDAVCSDECYLELGENSCVFCVIGSEGPECQRYGQFRWALMFKQMKAKREPIVPYPDCKQDMHIPGKATA